MYGFSFKKGNPYFFLISPHVKSILLLLSLFLCRICTVSAQTDTVGYRISMTDSVWQLHEVEVVARKKAPLLQITPTGTWNISSESMKHIPQFLGDTDPMKVFQLLPGIVNGGELNGGIYIRGSEPGHNLTTMDGATIYNPSHLLGLFSVFNNDHFSDFTLQKSYIPASQGGRLAGYMEMHPREELLQKPEVSGSAGILASRITTGFPLTSKASLYLSARVTYVNPIIRLMEGGMEENTTLRYDFQDYNATYVYQPSEKDKIVVNAYGGRDLLKMEEYQYQVDAHLKWLNMAGSARWNHQFTPKSRMTHRIYGSHYQTTLDARQNTYDIALPSRITEGGYKGEVSLDFRRLSLQTGVEASLYSLSPQYPETHNLFEGINLYRPKDYHVLTTAAFAEVTHRWKEWIFNAGVRYNGSYHSSYRKGDVDPRLQASYSLKKGGKISASFVMAHQYINQITVSTVGFPLDFWMPSTQEIPAQQALTCNIGYMQPLFGGDYEFSAEAYWRALNHQTIFDGGLYDMITQNYQIEEHVLLGKGRNYGIELFLKKNRGRLNGWVSYTLAWADRKFPSLRDGKWFPAKYDRRHNLNATLHFTLNNQWDFSAVYIYASGNAVTLPVALYMVGENAACVYEPYNSSRMPSYQRMDLSANFHFGRKHNQSLNASLYNVLKRHNPIFIQVSVKPSSDGKSLQIKKRNMALYSLLPSLSYTFKF
jgi:hypothetical protein